MILAASDGIGCHRELSVATMKEPLLSSSFRPFVQWLLAQDTGPDGARLVAETFRRYNAQGQLKPRHVRKALADYFDEKLGVRNDSLHAEDDGQRLCSLLELDQISLFIAGSDPERKHFIVAKTDQGIVDAPLEATLLKHEFVLKRPLCIPCSVTISEVPNENQYAKRTFEKRATIELALALDHCQSYPISQCTVDIVKPYDKTSSEEDVTQLQNVVLEAPPVRSALMQQAEEVYMVLSNSNVEENGNDDGVLTKDELMRAAKGDFGMFEAIDADGNGTVSLEEWLDYIQSIHDGKGEKGSDCINNLLRDLIKDANGQHAVKLKDHLAASFAIVDSCAVPTVAYKVAFSGNATCKKIGIPPS